jgi:hypothetical protein
MKLTKQKASLAKEIKRLESELLKNEQDAERLKAENLKIKLHTGLIEIITKFQKNALHNQMVRCNEITKKIEKHPGLPDKFKDWTKSDLAKRAAENGKGGTNTGEEAENFAVETTMREMEARGRLWADIGKDFHFALLVFHRLTEYKNAYLRRHILFLKKECHGLADTDSENSDAASAGFLLSQGEIDNPEVKEWVEKITDLEQSIRANPHLFSEEQKRKTKLLADIYRLALSGQQRAKWKQPALDSWLLLVWPLVEAEEWNWADVKTLAGKKFPDFFGPTVSNTNANAITTHCKKDLGLKIRNPNAVKPKIKPIDLKSPSPLLNFALQVGNSFPDFSSFPNKLTGK